MSISDIWSSTCSNTFVPARTGSQVKISTYVKPALAPCIHRVLAGDALLAMSNRYCLLPNGHHKFLQVALQSPHPSSHTSNHYDFTKMSQCFHKGRDKSRKACILKKNIRLLMQEIKCSYKGSRYLFWHRQG